MITVAPPRLDPGPRLSPREFTLLSRLVYELSGIHLSEHKQALLKARLSKRLRELGMNSFSEYFRYVARRDPQDAECVHLLDCIATNLTEFFRDPEHFNFLRQSFFSVFEREDAIRILSAGCSSGEEPYSIAMTALDHFGPAAQSKIQIVAGDLSMRMLARAQAGIYEQAKLKNVSMETLRAHFLKGSGYNRGLVQVAPQVRRMVDFRRINLAHPLSFERPFHGIFCRNVLIYFDRPVQRRVLDELIRWSVPHANLFLGFSESTATAHEGLRYVRPATYERRAAP